MGGKRYTEEQLDFIRANIELPYKDIREKFESCFGRAMNECQFDHIVARYNLRHGKRTYEWQMPQFRKCAEKGIKARSIDVGGISKRKGRRCIKVKDNKKSSDFIALARKIWIDHYGYISKDDKIIHLNGDIYDDRIENLCKVSSGEMGVMNKLRLINKDADLTKIGLAIARLKIKTNEVNKEQRKS